MIDNPQLGMSNSISDNSKRKQNLKKQGFWFFLRVDKLLILLNENPLTKKYTKGHTPPPTFPNALISQV